MKQNLVEAREVKEKEEQILSKEMVLSCCQCNMHIYELLWCSIFSLCFLNFIRRCDKHSFGIYGVLDFHTFMCDKYIIPYTIIREIFVENFFVLKYFHGLGATMKIHYHKNFPDYGTYVYNALT